MKLSVSLSAIFSRLREVSIEEIRVRARLEGGWIGPVGARVGLGLGLAVGVD